MPFSQAEMRWAWGVHAAAKPQCAVSVHRTCGQGTKSPLAIPRVALAMRASADAHPPGPLDPLVISLQILRVQS
jgi:hypothetical protein